MNSSQRYRIVHIDLSEESLRQPPSTEVEGIYTVVWWKDVPLGHFVIEANVPISGDDYHDHMVEAIFPTLDFYAAKFNLEASALDRNSLRGVTGLPALRATLDPIMARITIADVPESVPISVIVCTHERPVSLYTCLSSLTRLSPSPQEIIVVDNAPMGSSTRDVVMQFDNVRYVLEPKRGLDFARNSGVKQASTALITFTDDDMEVHPTWSYRVWETFKDEEVAAMTGIVFASSLKTEAQVHFENYWTFNRGYRDRVHDKEYVSACLPNGPPVWEIGGGGNMAIRRSVFDEVGYFHELLGAGAAGGSDDSEMLFRILAQGKTVKYNPRAVAYHTHRESISELNKQIFGYMRGFTVALLWQNRQRPDAGYMRNLLIMLVRYVAMCVKGFPRYQARSRTVWIELKGVLAGISFFYKKENRSLFSVTK